MDKALVIQGLIKQKNQRSFFRAKNAPLNCKMQGILGMKRCA